MNNPLKPIKKEYFYDETDKSIYQFHVNRYGQKVALKKPTSFFLQRDVLEDINEFSIWIGKERIDFTRKDLKNLKLEIIEIWEEADEYNERLFLALKDMNNNIILKSKQSIFRFKSEEKEKEFKNKTQKGNEKQEKESYDKALKIINIIDSFDINYFDTNKISRKDKKIILNVNLRKKNLTRRDLADYKIYNLLGIDKIIEGNPQDFLYKIEKFNRLLNRKIYIDIKKIRSMTEKIIEKIFLEYKENKENKRNEYLNAQRSKGE